MTDRRSSIDFYAPVETTALPRSKAPPPIEQPSLGDLWKASTVTSRADLPSADRDRMYDAWEPVLGVLNEGRGITRRYHNPAAGGANFGTYFFDEGGNLVTSVPSPESQEDHLWAAIDARRQVDPKAFPTLPASLDEFRAQVTARAKVNLRAARGTIARNQSWAGTAVELGAGIATSFRDPINIATMPLGGVGRNVATRILTAGVANAAVEAVEQPFVAIQREKLGETLTTREAAMNVAAAGLFGAGLQGVGEAAAPLLTRGADLARKARETIGWERMTPAEQAATVGLEREAEVATTTPFAGPAAAEAHVVRVDQAMRQLASPRAPTPPPAPAAPRFDAQSYANRVGVAESGGRWQVGADTSSAFGMYQITRGTWLRYAEQARIKGVSDDATWAKRTNPASQEAVFNAITRDNRAALARTGAPETFGNLYLMHFAGSGAGAKILRAAPETPIERLLSAKAIEANAFLKGKTAEDVIAWAHGKMGEKPHEGPVLSRQGFDDDDAGDIAWREAQAEVDAAERELASARDDRAGADDIEDLDALPGFDHPFVATRSDPFDGIADDAVPVGMDWEPDPAVQGRGRILDDAPVAMRAEPVRPTLSKAIADDLEEKGLGPRSTLNFLPREGTPGLSVINEEGHFATAVFRDAEGVAQGVVRMPLTDEAREISSEVSSYVMPRLRRQGIGTRLYDALRDAGYDVDGLSGTKDLTPDGAAFVNARRSRAAESGGQGSGAGETPAVAAPDDLPIVGFDHPDDVAAARQIDSLEHDLRMFLLEEDAKGFTVRLNEEGDVVSAADAIADLDADDAAIQAARACMVPGGVDA